MNNIENLAFFSVATLLLLGWVVAIFQTYWSRKLFRTYERVSRIEVTKLFSAQGMISGTVKGDYFERLKILKGVYFGEDPTQDVELAKARKTVKLLHIALLADLSAIALIIFPIIAFGI